jgi:MarR family 2-MHQ and catechol resistance regulon transcriptional repressor
MDDLSAYIGPRMSYYEERFSEFRAEDALVVISLIRTEDVYARAREAYLARFGLSGATLNLLMFLDSSVEEAVPMSVLSESLLVSKANITGLMDSLEKRGYVRRRPDPQDRRVILAEITEKGRAVLHRLLPRHFRAVEAMLKDLSPKEKEALVELLARIRAGVANGYIQAVNQDEETER